VLLRLATLRKRAEFERIRGGGRWSTAGFVLEGKARPAGPDIATWPGSRFGFTISRKVGKAVVRNRIRRRLRAALVEIAPTCADPRFDYVIIARTVASTLPFVDLKSDLAIALRRVNEGRRPGAGRRNSPAAT
jgi:ribonuclease P protein component